MGRFRPLIIFVLLLLSFHCPILAQTIKLISATDQGWSGGVAGRHGNNYNFVINCSNLKQEIVPEAIWIGREMIQLNLKDSVSQGNTIIQYSKNKSAAVIKVAVSTTYDDYNMHQGKASANQQAPPVIYKGVTLISYRYNGQKHYYTIRRFTVVFPPINYP